MKIKENVKVIAPDETEFMTCPRCGDTLCLSIGNVSSDSKDSSSETKIEERLDTFFGSEC